MAIHKLFGKDFQLKQQIFDDFKRKSSVLVDSTRTTLPSLRLKLGIRGWAKSVYAAYQVFQCYLYGFGTRQDIPSAWKYLVASAQGGYCNAFCTSARFHKRFPSVEFPKFVPDIEPLCQVVSLGPWRGVFRFLIDKQVLCELAPDRLRQTIDQINSSAFSELGDSHEDRDRHKEESFRGPDVQYQWLAKGSIALFQSLVAKCNPLQLMKGFQSGLFPLDGKNYNEETALYMCCRVGNAMGVLTLLREFEWFRKQVNVATSEGCLPLHCLYCFASQDVQQVGEALLANGANINAVDNRKWRAVDYAIAAGKEDVAFYLFSQRKLSSYTHTFQPELILLKETAIFRYLANYTADIQTALRSALNGSIKILEHCVQDADLVSKVEMLAYLSNTNLDTRIATGRFDNVPVLLQSISKLSDDDFLKVEKLLQQAMVTAIQLGNSDILSGIIEQILPSKGVSEQSVMEMLETAAQRSHLPDVQAILTIPFQWTVYQGFILLQTVITLAGPEQFSIVETLVGHMDSLGLARDIVNQNITDDCSPDCKLHYSHYFSPSLFSAAVICGQYEIANLIAPYTDHEKGFPTALYHVLNSPSRRTLGHIEFLMNLGPEHRKYVCYPIYNRTVLQVVAKNSGM